MLPPQMLPRFGMGGGFHLLSAQTKECIALSATRRYGNPTTLGAVKRAETNFELTTVQTAAQRWIWSDNDGDDFCRYGRK